MIIARNSHHHFHNGVRCLLGVVLLLSGILLAGPNGQIAGEVIDEKSMEPLANANIVVITRWEGNTEKALDPLTGASTDAKGLYLITDLTPGKYTLKASFMGYADLFRKKIEVKANQTITINFTLTPRVIQGERVTVIADRYSRTADYSTIATKFPVAIHKTPLSIDIITHKVLQEQQAAILSDALINSTSINIQNSLGTQDYFLIRGFDSNSAGLVLIDGIHEPDASPFTFYGFGYYNLYNVEQVEILKGPAAFLYGSNTLSGSIHLIRKNPRFSNFGILKTRQSRHDSHQESFDMNFCARDSSMAMRLNGLFESDKHFRPHTRNMTYAFNPSLRWRPNNFSMMTVTLEFMHEDIKPDVGIPLYMPDETWQFPDVSHSASFQMDSDTSVYDNYRLRVDYEREMAQNRRLNYSFFLHKLHGKSRFTLPLIPYRFVGQFWIVPRNMYTIDQDQFVIGNQLEYHLAWYTGKLKHNLLCGLDATFVDNSTEKRASVIHTIALSNQQVIHSNDPRAIVTFPPVPTNTSQWIVAAYLIDYLSISEKCQLFGGARLDYIDYSTDRQNASFDYVGRSLSSDPIPFAQNFLKMSPMLGLVLKESEQLWFYANTGRAFAAGQRIVDEPEVSTQYEIGYRYRSLNNRLRTSASLYSIKKENMSIAITGPLQGDVHVSNGSQKSSGFEFDFTVEAIRDWFLSAKNSYTYAEYIRYNALSVDDDGKYTLKDFSGNTPLFVPNQILYLKLYKEFTSGLSVGTGLRFVSAQYANYENDFEIEKYVVYQSHIAYQFRHWLFQLNMDKYTKDKLYFRGLGPYSVIPVEPLEIRFSVEAAF